LLNQLISEMTAEFPEKKKKWPLLQKIVVAIIMLGLMIALILILQKLGIPVEFEPDTI